MSSTPLPKPRVPNNPHAYGSANVQPSSGLERWEERCFEVHFNIRILNDAHLSRMLPV